MQPHGLRGVVLLLCVQNLPGFLAIDHTTPALALAFLLAVVAFEYIAIRGLWRGQNWARWIHLLASAIAVVDLLRLGGRMSPLQRGVWAVEGAFGAYLLWWLNSAPVKAYFTRSPT